MRTLTIRGMDPEIYERLKASAVRHRRSLNSEILVCIERVVGPVRLDPVSWLADLDRLRAEVSHPLLGDAFIDAAKREDRR